MPPRARGTSAPRRRSKLAVPGARPRRARARARHAPFSSRLFSAATRRPTTRSSVASPRVWGLLYKGLEHPRIHRGTSPVRHALDRVNVRELVSFIERERPPRSCARTSCRSRRSRRAAGAACSRARSTASSPISPRTRSGPSTASTLSFVATAAVREELASWGVRVGTHRRERHPDRSAVLARARSIASRRARNSSSRPTARRCCSWAVATASGPLASLAERLLDLPSAPQLLVVCGKNARLRMRMRAVADVAPGRVRVLGFTDQVPALLSAADVIVTKAGGLTCSESLAMRTPDGRLPAHARAGGEATRSPSRWPGRRCGRARSSRSSPRSSASSPTRRWPPRCATPAAARPAPGRLRHRPPRARDAGPRRGRVRAHGPAQLRALRRAPGRPLGARWADPPGNLQRAGPQRDPSPQFIASEGCQALVRGGTRALDLWSAWRRGLSPSAN